MRKNKMALLGLLGLFGLIGIPTQQYALFGFFGFFGYLLFLRIKNDELFEKNIHKASKNGFIVSVIGMSITIVLVALLEKMDVAMIGLAVTFFLQMLTYSISVSIYENKN